MKSETLEILIGKYLDGEISPAEQRMLETELKNDPHARDLLEQLRDLHGQTRQALASAVFEQGKTPDEIFEQAWRRRTKRPFLSFGAGHGRWRFAAGLAAGFALGLALHLVLTLNSSPRPGGIKPKPIAQATDNYLDVYTQPLSAPLTKDAQKTIRNLDWYGFTDKDGVRWLVQGVRENKVRPAVYQEGL
jgi:hypothetical protein